MINLHALLPEMLGPRHPVAVAALVTPQGTSTAALGAPADADVEIGSVSKGLTGLLYVDAVERGEVRPATSLGEVLPVQGDVARVTLGSLATHRSGLPRLPAAAQPWRRTVALLRHGTNPYGETLDELLQQVRTTRVRQPRPRYSNLGFELLGHAVARAAGTTYAQLLTDRLSAPLDLSLTVPASPGELGPGALAGRDRRRRPREPWTGEAIGPAGGVRATADDLARLMSALLDGSAPGIAALDPVAKLGQGARIGAAWITVRAGDDAVTWHNGGTGGFSSWVGVSRATGTGAAVVSATSRSVDRAGFRLLEAARRDVR